jgi:hypothetical protein
LEKAGRATKQEGKSSPNIIINIIITTIIIKRAWYGKGSLSFFSRLL